MELKKLVGLLFVFGCLLLAGEAAAGTFYYFTSDPGDYIGGGETKLYNLSDSTFTPSVRLNSNSDITGCGFDVSTFDGSEWWRIEFDAPGVEMLVPGVYSNASRWPFNNNAAGLSIYGCGRGCNELSGSFEIFELTYSPDKTHIETFAAQFVQHCENGTPALHGVVEYIVPSTTTTTVEPTTTTTTISTETCRVEFFPRRLSKVVNTVMQLQAFIIRGDENASFPKATTIDWGAYSVETMLQAALGKRIIIALVLVNGNNQKVGDIYEVTVGDCTGELPVTIF